MSISGNDNNIKIWNTKNWECILNLTNINKSGYLESACFFQSNNNIYIITSNYNYNNNPEPIKVYNFNGEKIKEITDSNKSTFFIDIYHDINLSKHYIITCNTCFSQSYIINVQKKDYILYHSYNDNDNNNNYLYTYSVIIKNNNKIINLIESCSDGNIRIFNFHSGLLLNKIKIKNSRLYGMCLWNDNYLFVGCEDHTIKIINLKEGLIDESLNSHTGEVFTIKKVILSKYEECLISQSQREIKLWKIQI